MTVQDKKLKTLLDDPKFLKEFYQKLLPSFENFILKNSGSKEDAKDVFQEALVITYGKLCNPTFELRSSLETFVFAVGKLKWMSELRKSRKKTSVMILDEPEEGNDIEELIINKERTNLYLKHFAQLSQGCKDVMELFFNGFKISEIAKKMNFSSEGYTKKRKHNCQKKLISLIKGDQLFKEYNHG